MGLNHVEYHYLRSVSKPHIYLIRFIYHVLSTAPCLKHLVDVDG